MPQLRSSSSSSSGNNKETSLQRLLRGIGEMGSVLSETNYSKTGTVNQSARMGLASAFGLGGAYIAASRLNQKAQKLLKGIKTILHSGDGQDADDVQEEDVFKQDTPKQPGFIGITGLVKYGFKHIIKAIKKRNKTEEKEKKSFLSKLLKGLKSVFSSKWFWLATGITALGVGIWSLISNLTKQASEALNWGQIAENSSPITDPDFLASAREDQYWEEYQEVLDSIKASGKEADKKFKQRLDELHYWVDKEGNKHYYVDNSKNMSYISQSNSYFKNNPPIYGVVPSGQGSPLNSPLLGGTYRISSRYGLRVHPVSGKAESFHKGIDLATNFGAPVLAAMGGQVSEVGFDERIDKKTGKKIGAGRYVKIRHYNGLESVYAHLNPAVNVRKNQIVQSGEMIGSVGMTGGTTGPHLHFGVKDSQGNFLNPELFTHLKTGGANLPSAQNMFIGGQNYGLVGNSMENLTSSFNELDKAIVDLLNDESRLNLFKKSVKDGKPRIPKKFKSNEN